MKMHGQESLFPAPETESVTKVDIDTAAIGAHADEHGLRYNTADIQKLRSVGLSGAEIQAGMDDMGGKAIPDSEVRLDDPIEQAVWDAQRRRSRGSFPVGEAFKKAHDSRIIHQRLNESK